MSPTKSVNKGYCGYYSHTTMHPEGIQDREKRVLVLDSWNWKLLCCVWVFAIPYNPWNSPGRNTGVGSLSLLQRIFPTQGLNLGLPYCRQILYQLSYKGSPKILEWVAYPFSSGSSWPRNRTGVSCIAGRFFPSCATWEAPSTVSPGKSKDARIL